MCYQTREQLFYSALFTIAHLDPAHDKLTEEQRSESKEGSARGKINDVLIMLASTSFSPAQTICGIDEVRPDRCLGESGQNLLGQMKN